MLKRYAYLIALLCYILILSVSGCSIPTPGAPIWTIQVSIPFQNRTYKLSELVADSSNLANDGYGIVYAPGGEMLAFVFRDTLERQTLEGELNYDESDTGSYSNEIGIIEVDAPSPDSTIITTRRLFKDYDFPYNGPVDSVRFTSIDDTMQFNRFNWVQINKGWMHVEVSNHFPVPIDNLKLEYFNRIRHESIGEFNFTDQILSGESVIDSLILDGSFLRNDIVLRSSGFIDRQSGNVMIRGSEQLETVLTFSDLEADSASAEIREHLFNTSDSLEFEDKNRLTHGVIERGWARISIENRTPLRSTNQTIFTNILDSTGAPLVYDAVLHPGTVRFPWVLEDSIDMTDFTIVMDIDNQQIFLTSSTVTEDSRETLYNDSPYQTVSRFNGVDTKYWTGELIYKEITGSIASVVVDIPQKTTNIRLPEGLDDIEFVGDTLFLELYNGVGLPLQLNAQLIGTNDEDARTSRLPIDAILTGGINFLAIPDGDRLLSIGPEHITISGEAKIGADYFPELADTVVTLVDTSSFSGTMELKSDLRLILGATQFRSSLQLIEDELDYPIQSAVINMQIANSIPFAGEILITMGSDTTNMTILASVDLEPPLILDNRVAVPVFDTITVVLGEPEFDIIMQPNVYTRQIIKLRGLTGSEVWLFGEDSLTVNADAEVEYLIDLVNDKAENQ